MSKFKDFVMPSNFKFPESKRRSLEKSIDNETTSPFKNSTSVPSKMKSSRRQVPNTPENEYESIRRPESDGCKSPDLNYTNHIVESSGLRDLNNSNLYVNKARKSPDLDFTNETSYPPVMKYPVNLINEATNLLSPPSTKSCLINLSPDMSYDARKHKDYSKMDIFANSVHLNNSQSSINSEPRSGKLIVTNAGGESPDLYLTKQVKSSISIRDIFLTEASNATDTPDIFSTTELPSEEVSFIQNSQCSGEYASPSPIKTLISTFNKDSGWIKVSESSTPPRRAMSRMLHDSRLALSPDFSSRMIHSGPPQIKRMVQESASPPNKKPRLKQTLVSPVEASGGKLAFPNGNQSPSICRLKDEDHSKNERKSAKKANNVLNSISKTMRDIAVDDYYAQTISSQYMSSMNKMDDSDLFHISCSWNDESMKVASQSILQPENITTKPSYKDEEGDWPDILRDCQDYKCNSLDEIENDSKLVVDKGSFDVYQAGGEGDTSLDLDFKDITGQVNIPPESSEVLLSQEWGFLDEAIVISDDTTVSGPLQEARDLVAKTSSDSTPENNNASTRLVKSLKEMIDFLKQSNQANKGRNGMPPNSAKLEGKNEKTVLPGLLINDPDESFNKNVDNCVRDLNFIETSPNRKVQLWLDRHLGAQPQYIPQRHELQELNIEDFDSEEINKDGQDNFPLDSMIEEVPEVDKENVDLLNIVETQSTAEPVDKQLIIEDNNTEKKTIEDLNSENFVDVNINSQENMNGTDKDVIFQSQIIEFNTKISRKQPTQRMIEEINTEKCENTIICEDNEDLEIECPGSPNTNMGHEDIFDAAKILMSFNKALPSSDIPMVPEKSIKFKPGSLGARLRSELGKQKSATEIWHYEVDKAIESRDQTSLLQLYRGRLNLVMISCWSESSHVVVRAKALDSPNNSMLLLLLQNSDFPKRFKNQQGQHISIFPPWINHWVPEFGMSFLTNIERIRFTEHAKSNHPERVQTSELTIDPLDDDFYMKLIGLGGSLIQKKQEN